MERGDSAAAHAALLLADKYVRVPLEAQEKIGAYVQQAPGVQDVAAAESAAAAARTAGIIAGLLATLLAAAIVFLVSRGIRRSAAQVLERLSPLESEDAAALQVALDAVASGDLTHSVSADTPAIANPGADEIGDIARATNGIRDPPARFRGLLQRHARPARRADRRGRGVVQQRRRRVAPDGRHVAGGGRGRG